MSDHNISDRKKSTGHKTGRKTTTKVAAGDKPKKKGGGG